MKVEIVAGNRTDITNLITHLKWSGSRLQVARKLEITLAQDKRDKHLPVIRVDCGYTVIFYDDEGNNVFEGNIYELERNRAESTVKLLAYDHLIVMTRSRTTRKYSDAYPEEITRSLCKELGVIEGNIAETGVKVSFIANNKTGYEQIMMSYTEAHKKNDKLYQLVMQGPKLNVIEKGALIEGLILDSSINMENSIYKKSIESLINQVAVVDEQGNLVSYEKLDDSIANYSMFQVTYKIDPNKDTKFLLKKNNKSEKLKIEISGTRFVTLETVEVVGSAEIEVEAVKAGSSGNVAANSIIQIPLSIPGINSVTNKEATHDGYDEEDDDTLRARYLNHVRLPATSGNPYQYCEWAMEVTGVGAAKCIRTWNGPNTVKLIIVNSNMEEASDYLIEQVYNHIEEVRAIGAMLTVVSAKPKIINISAEIIGTLDEEDFRQGINGYFTRLTRLIMSNVRKAARQYYVSYAQISSVIIVEGGADDHSNLLLNAELKIFR